jgi:hypothetical protein
MSYEEKLDNALLSLRERMLEKYNDRTELSLSEFGEVGMLVRASDDLECMKNVLADEDFFCGFENEDAWLNLAEHAVQATVLFHTTEEEALLDEIYRDGQEREDMFNRIASSLDEIVEDAQKQYPGCRMRFTLI